MDPLLVSFEDAKAHLQIRDTTHDTDVFAKLTQASAIIRDYLKDRNDAAWTETTAPGPVQAATLILLGNLYEHRGDDFALKGDAANDVLAWEVIGRLLVRFRDPALA
jgi:hypothetical protein